MREFHGYKMHHSFVIVINNEGAESEYVERQKAELKFYVHWRHIFIAIDEEIL